MTATTAIPARTAIGPRKTAHSIMVRFPPLLVTGVVADEQDPVLTTSTEMTDDKLRDWASVTVALRL
jgi:hypothetical protein